MDAGRRAAALEASRYVSGIMREQVEIGEDPRLVLGLGSGRTAELFIRALGDLPRAEREQLVCIPTSDPTRRAAERVGLSVSGEHEASLIELAVDGADEIGPDLSLVKGGGGAMFRERIVAEYAWEFIVIADEGKLVDQHGEFPLPIEVSPFCFRHSVAEIAMTLVELDYELDPVRDISIRSVGGAGKSMLTTENGNYIIDVSLGEIADLAELDVELSMIPGVVGHGLFLDVADFALIGSADGRVRRIEPETPTVGGSEETNGDGKAA